MALGKAEIADLFLEEQQIQRLLKKAGAQRDAAKQAAEQQYLASLTQADDAYVAATAAAQSRLLDLQRALDEDGIWKG